MGTKVHLASTHHPQTNGLTERMNRTLINLIKKVTHQHPHTWDNMLPLFEFAYNQTPNSTTGIPPFLANQGYLPSTPAALLTASYTLTALSKPTAEFVQHIRKTFAKVHEQIREAEEKEKAQIQKHENAKRGSPQFQIGDQGTHVLATISNIFKNTTQTKTTLRRTIHNHRHNFTTLRPIGRLGKSYVTNH